MQYSIIHGCLTLFWTAFSLTECFLECRFFHICIETEAEIEISAHFVLLFRIISCDSDDCCLTKKILKFISFHTIQYLILLCTILLCLEAYPADFNSKFLARLANVMNGYICYWQTWRFFCVITNFRFRPWIWTRLKMNKMWKLKHEIANKNKIEGD